MDKRPIKTCAKNNYGGHLAAVLDDINYQAGRKLNKKLIDRLSTCEYIREAHNIIIAGATGTGKSYIACSLGMEACKHYYATKYIRLPELLAELAVAGVRASLKKRSDTIRNTPS